MTLHPRDESTNRYPIMEELLGDPTGERILDYGSNRGNLMAFSNGTITEDDYIGVDIDKGAVAAGREEFPNADWHHYNGFNPVHNQSGIVNDPYPDVGPYDLFWAYSVFSHTDLTDFKRTSRWLAEGCTIGGAVSFLSTTEPAVLNYFYQRRIDEYGACTDFREDYKDANVFYVIDNAFVSVDQITLPDTLRCKYLLAFYNPEWLVEQLDGYELTKSEKTKIPFLTLRK